MVLDVEYVEYLIKVLSVGISGGLIMGSFIGFTIAWLAHVFMGSFIPKYFVLDKEQLQD